MGETTNQPKTLEERVQAAAKAAQDRNIDFDIWFIAARGEWNSNWSGDQPKATLGELLDVIEEEIRTTAEELIIRDVEPDDPETPEPPSLPAEPKYQPWKP